MTEYWKCPWCGECFESATVGLYEKCSNCQEAVFIYYNAISWEEFAVWCRDLKGGL